MVSTLPKDLLRTVFSYTESKSVNETLGETLDWAKNHILEVENDYGFVDGEVEIECVFVCNNTTVKSSRFYGPVYVPIFGNWEPHISFNLKHVSERFELVLLIEWEDWADPSVNFTYKKEIKFEEGDPFKDFDLEATAPRSAGCCKEALLAFMGVNVGDNLCDQEELEEMERNCGLLIVQEQNLVYRAKELAEFVLKC